MCCPLNNKTKARRVQEGAPGRYKPCSGRWTMPNSCRGRAKPFFQQAKYWQVATSATFLPSVTGFVGWAEHIDRWAEHIDLVFSSKMLAAEFYYHGVSTKVVVVFIIAKPVLHSLRGLGAEHFDEKKVGIFSQLHDFMDVSTSPLFPLHGLSTSLCFHFACFHFTRYNSTLCFLFPSLLTNSFSSVSILCIGESFNEGFAVFICAWLVWLCSFMLPNEAQPSFCWMSLQLKNDTLELLLHCFNQPFFRG